MRRTHLYRRSRRSRRLLICLLACGLALPATLTASTHRASAVRVLDAVEVGSTLTGEFGFARPTGLAYVPGKRLLLVAAAGPQRTRLLRIGRFEDAHGSLAVPKISNPSTFAWDPVRAHLTAVDGKKLVAVRSSDLSASRPATQRTDIASLRLRSAQGATFDPRSGSWFVLDSRARAIVRVPSADGGAKPSRISLQRLEPGRLRGLARNPADGLLYVANTERDRIFAVDGSGRVRKAFAIEGARIRNLRALVFAPSADRTDSARVHHLYVADAGGGKLAGRVLELSLARQVGTSGTLTGKLVRTIHTSQLGTPAPDPAGITYVEATDTLLVSDSEVDEMSIYRGANLYSVTRTGRLVGTGTTAGFSREPTGVGIDPASSILYTSDDVKDRVFITDPGPDGRHGTADDSVTSISTIAYGSHDPEGVEFEPGSGHLFICDGSGKEVYDIDPTNGVFGDGNDVMAHFDVGRYGIRNCEGIGSDPQRRTLLVIDDYERKIFELTRSGQLLRAITIPLSYADLWLAGVTVAPTSNANDAPNAMSYWIVDRHVDNNANPKENDGRIYEVLRP
jgi:DNA-binding beta-propeller fold protein YncE